MKWVGIPAAVAIHEQQIAEHGGAAGVRDHGLLASALARPQHIAAYEDGGDSDVARLAAAYCHGVIKNHPFVDGNKRTAFAVLGLFLAKNGYNLMADDASCLKAVLALADSSMSEAKFAAWVRDNIELGKPAPKRRVRPKIRNTP